MIAARLDCVVELAVSTMMKRSEIAVLLFSMCSEISVTSLRSWDTASLVEDAASLSAVIMFLLSPIPWCISAQYLPYAAMVYVLRSVARARSICWLCNRMQLF